MFFIEPHNYYKEIIEQLNNFIIKNNFNFAKTEKTSESILLFNLRAYAETFVMQRHLAIKFLESFNKSINFESNVSSFLASHNEKERLLKITPKNVRSIYRQACLTDLPIQICIETHSSCNFRCLLCPYHGGSK